MIQITYQCIYSRQKAISICSNKDCKISPFICNSCLNSKCKQLHKHKNRYNLIQPKDLKQTLQNTKFKTSQEVNKKEQKIIKQIYKIKQNLDLIQVNFKSYKQQCIEQIQYYPQISKTIKRFRNNDLQSITGSQIHLLIQSQYENNIEINKIQIHSRISSQINRISKFISQLQNKLNYFIQKKQNNNLIQSYQDQQQNLTPDQLLRKAISFQNLGQIQQAIKYYTKAIQIKPDINYAYYNRATIYHKQQKLKQAEQDYTNSIKYQPNNYNAYNNRALIYIKNNKFQNAIDDFNNYLKQNVNDIQAYVHRAQCYQQLKNYEAALADLALAIKDKQQYDLYYRRASIYKKLENWAQYQKDIDQVITLNPDEQLYFERGYYYYQKNKIEQALSDYNSALKLNPKNYKALLLRSVLYANNKNPQKSLEDLNQALKCNPNGQNQIYQKRAIIYEMLGKYDEAKFDYETLLKKNPKDDGLLFRLSLLLIKNQKYNQAQQKLNDAIKQNPNKPKYYEHRIELCKFLKKNSLVSQDEQTLKRLQNKG